MSIVLPGVIKDGGVALPEKVKLPEGMAVKVTIEDAAAPTPRPHPFEPQVKLSAEEWLKLPAHGMWADRTDIGDSAEFVHEMRKEWETRLNRTS